jgi:hypothetical protein
VANTACGCKRRISAAHGLSPSERVDAVALGVADADAVSLGVAVGEAVEELDEDDEEKIDEDVEVLLGVADGLADGVPFGVLEADGVGPSSVSGASNGIVVGTQASPDPSVGAATVGSAVGSSVGSAVSPGVGESDGSGLSVGEALSDRVPEVRSVEESALSPGVGESEGAGVSSSLGCAVGVTHGALLFSVGTADAVGVGVGEAVRDVPDVGEEEGEPAAVCAGTALVSSNTGAPMVRAFSAASRSPAPSCAAASTITGALSNSWVDSPAVTTSGSAPPTTVAQSAGRCSAAATPFTD